MHDYSAFIAFPVMLVLWLTCVILTPLTDPTTVVVAERSHQETRIAIELQNTLAFASKLQQETLQAHLLLGCNQEKATLSRAVLTVTRDVAKDDLPASHSPTRSMIPRSDRKLLTCSGLRNVVQNPKRRRHTCSTFKTPSDLTDTPSASRGENPNKAPLPVPASPENPSEKIRQSIFRGRERSLYPGPT